MIEEQFITTRHILSSYKHKGFLMMNIIGEKGYGKTTMAMKVMCQVFMACGYSEDEAYKLALEHLLFDKREVVQFLVDNSGHQVPVMTWDDIRVHASGMSYITSPIETQALMGCIDTARDSVAGFITTSPSMQGVLGFIKRDLGYHIMLRKAPNGIRKATAYKKYELPWGRINQTKSYVDYFNYRLPDWVYEEVCRKRQHYKEIILNNLLRSIEKEENNHQRKRWVKEKEVVENV